MKNWMEVQMFVQIHQLAFLVLHLAGKAGQLLDLETGRISAFTVQDAEQIIRGI